MNIKTIVYGLIFGIVFGYELSFFSFERMIDINMPLFVPFMGLVTIIALSLLHKD